MENQKYLEIISHYENCLKVHGDSHLGVDWPKLEDVDKRYQVMLDLIQQPVPENQKVSLLDFGCGASHLYEYISKKGLRYVDYSGLDISEMFVDLSERKFPCNRYYCGDVLTGQVDLPEFDYIVLNGVFTEKRSLSFDEMLIFFQNLVTYLYGKARIGLAFNVMSKQVDWEREDLFHLPLDTMAFFLTKNLSRHFVVRNDYGLFEYTVYLYRKCSR